MTYRNDLAAAYKLLIGYDPVEDWPEIPTREIEEMLRDWLIEATREESA